MAPGWRMLPMTQVGRLLPCAVQQRNDNCPLYKSGMSESPCDAQLTMRDPQFVDRWPGVGHLPGV